MHCSFTRRLYLECCLFGVLAYFSKEQVRLRRFDKHTASMGWYAGRSVNGITSSARCEKRSPSLPSIELPWISPYVMVLIVSIEDVPLYKDVNQDSSVGSSTDSSAGFSSTSFAAHSVSRHDVFRAGLTALSSK